MSRFEATDESIRYEWRRRSWQSALDAAGDSRTPGPNAPLGGTLVNLFATEEEARALDAEALRWPRLVLPGFLQSDLELLAVGAYSPLRGFLGQDDFMSVCSSMHLADGTPWSIPIVLPVDDEFAKTARHWERIGLWDDSRLLAVLDVEGVYKYDKARYAQRVYGTDSLEHPGVARLHTLGNQHVAGRVRVVHRPNTIEFPQYHLDPIETRILLDEKGWRTVVAFQTRNPIHRAHEFIQKSALEIVDGILVHPLVGETKSDDIPADVRMQCYKALLRSYYPRKRTLLAVYPAFMRYAGPREAIFHALVRKNYGCTHFIVGRDHAGVGNFYGTYDAQKIFSRFKPEDLGITPLCYENSFFCRSCEGMASHKTCPHPAEERLHFSGTQIREMLRRGESPPSEFTRAEIGRILIDWTRKSHETAAREGARHQAGG